MVWITEYTTKEQSYCITLGHQQFDRGKDKNKENMFMVANFVNDILQVGPYNISQYSI